VQIVGGMNIPGQVIARAGRLRAPNLAPVRQGEDRIRYTPKTSFGTFPWPSGTLDEVADVSRRLYARRSEICVERNIGLTKLYNPVAHDPDETNRRLLELNRAIAAGEIPCDPFAVAKVV
jgi:hypothetical protein